MILRNLVALLLLVTGLQVQAEMNLSTSIVELKEGAARRDDVIVFNSGSDTLYVSVEPLQVLQPGTDEERRERIVDPQAAGLLVTPNKLIVPPGGRKTVRMVALETSDQERIFRVNFTPIAPPLELEEGSGAQIQVIVAYQVLVMSRASAPAQSFKATREGARLRIINDGNSNLLLTEGLQCPSEAQLETREGCATLPSRRLYAGNDWVTELPLAEGDSPVEYTVTGIDGASKQQF